MAGVTWCEQDGVPYLFVDYSGTTEAELLAVMAEGTEAVRAAPYGLRMLVDVTDTPFSRAFLKGVKDSTAQVLGPQGAVIALYGLSGMQATMLRGYNAVGGGARAVPFRDRDAALRYLISR